jgi:hypothetical protein
MNLEKTTKLLSEAKRIYNDSSPEAYTNFICWTDSFNGNKDGEIARTIRQYIEEKNNSPNCLVWRIDDFYSKEILKFVQLIDENREKLDKLSQNFCKEFLDVIHNPKNDLLENIIHLHGAENSFLIYLRNSMKKYFQEKNENIKIIIGKGKYDIDVDRFLESPPKNY